MSRILISSGANINLNCNHHGSILNFAIWKNEYYMMKDLISRKINISHTDYHGNNCFHLIFKHLDDNEVNTIKIFVQLVQNYSTIYLKEVLKCRNSFGQGAFEIGIKFNRFNLLENIIRYHRQFFDSNYLNYNNENYLHLAAKYNEYRTMNLLLQNFNINPFVKNSQG